MIPLHSVLIIDGEDCLRRNIERYLRRRGYATHGTGDGAGGLRVVERLRPRLVIVDHELPDMSGFRVMDRIRERHAAIPVILMTCHHCGTGHGGGSGAAAFAFLPKPFSLGELGTLVQRAVAAAVPA